MKISNNMIESVHDLQMYKNDAYPKGILQNKIQKLINCKKAEL